MSEPKPDLPEPSLKLPLRSDGGIRRPVEFIPRTEPTTERGAWLEEVRADVERAARRYPADLKLRNSTDRTARDHAPALLRALEAVEAELEAEGADMVGPHGSDWDAGYDCALASIRQAIDEARGRA